MLNGKELMLGDYVNIADYDFPEAAGVVKEIHANGEEMYISIDGQVYDVLSDKDISVLFLSKTFFLENGFKELQIYKDFTLLYNKDVKVAVKIIHGNCFKCEINGIKLEYVHEFQHLMRLLGLFKYANNLKI
ncbi:MAG: hypothetical protein SPF70_08155 [Lachnospiraceae bacterium]|nr:hypothetical protein [Lachnospiraceae bacterium]